MKVLKILLFMIGGIAVIAAVLVQIEAFDYAFQPTGYPKRSAVLDTFEMYALFSDDPRLEPFVVRVRELAQENGQVESIGVGEVTLGRKSEPTTVHVYVTRNDVRYLEIVSFNDDGTLKEIVSTLDTRPLNY